MNDRCDDILNEDGSSYRCVLERGHSGLHENGEWEWTSRDMARRLTSLKIPFRRRA